MTAGLHRWFRSHALRVVVLVGCLSSVAPSQNSETRFKHLSIEDGLSQATATCVLQDRYGFIWIGTNDGLNMYNGYEFRVFRYDPGNPGSLSNNIVSCLYEDKSGTLWVGTDDGLNRFDRQRESFIHYRNDPRNPNSISSNVVYRIREDRLGVLWVGTWDKGLNAFDREHESFQRFPNDPRNPTSLSGNYVGAIYEDRSGALWVGTDKGLDLLDRQQNSFQHYRNDPKDRNSLSINVVLSLYEDRSGTLWVGTSAGLNRFDRRKGSFVRYVNDPKDPNSLSDDVVWSILEDRAGAFWIGTQDGLNVLDRESNRFTRYRNDPQKPGSLSNNTVYSIVEDRSGVLWFGADVGLNLLDREGKSFTCYQNDPRNPNSLTRNRVISLFEDHAGTLWIGTQDGGLNRLDRRSMTFTSYRNDPWNPNSLTGNNITALYEDRAGELWIGESNGLNLLDRRNKSFRRYQHDQKDGRSLSHTYVTAICEDRDGALWVGTNGGGLNVLDRGNGTFKRYWHDPLDSTSLSDGGVMVIYRDHTDKLWIGTIHGLNVFNPKDESFTHYLHDPANPGSLSSNYVNTIAEDRSGAIWIGTGEALDLFDRGANAFRKFRGKDGMLSGAVNGILEDGSGRLWLSTNKGIARFDPTSGDVRNYDVSDGLPSNGFNPRACCQTRDGMMYFGSFNGVTCFHPDSIRDNQFIPPIVITDLLLFNKPVQAGVDYEGFVLPQAVTTADELVLSYREEVFTLEFSALCFASPEEQKYAYRLEGFDKEWVSTDAGRRLATYTNLDPGTYVFRVKGSNHDGIWNEEGRSLRIRITPPWWKSTWAYIGYGLGIVGLLYTFRRSEKARDRLKQQAKLEHARAENLREVDAMKSRFFANISHEFRTPLTLMLGPIQKWRERTSEQEEAKDLEMAERNAQRLLRLINQLLDLSRIEAGSMKLRAEPRNIVSFVRGIAQSFESSAGRRGVALSVVTESDEITVWFDRDKLENIVTNLLSNAFKFTREGGRVSVRISHPAPHIPNHVAITVSDTGIGIPADQVDKVFDRFYQVDASQTREHEGSGIGLALTKELVELHHGTIGVRSEAGKGSEFTVILPVGREHLGDDEILMHAEPTRPGTFPEPVVDVSDRSAGRESEREKVSSGSPCVILIIEDNADVRAYMREYLDPAYDVREACDGEEGIRKAKEIIPDLIISDVMMPKKDGYELCRTLKLDEKTSHVPVVLLTARATREDKIAGLETGADDYLIKPFDARELLTRVRNLIELRKKLRERFRVGQVLKPGEIAVTSIDDAFLQKVKSAVEQNMEREAFSVDDLGREVGMSRSQLFRKLTALTGQAPSDFIRYMRLHRAMDLLKKNSGTVSEVAYTVGFNSVTYFTKCFREQFEILPSEVRKQQHPQ